MANGNGLSELNDVIKHVTEFFVDHFDSDVDKIIEQLDMIKSFVTLLQQEFIEIGNGEIVFTRKYFGIM